MPSHDPITGLVDLASLPPEPPIAAYMDEALHAKAARSRELGARGGVRQAEILLRVPAEYRMRAAREATREMNMVGGRYSDCLESAARTINAEVGRGTGEE